MKNKPDSLEQLQENVRYLMDRTAIMDCIAQHARGQDRHDAELLTSAYHIDGIDEHGNAINDAKQYAAWVNAMHDSQFGLHTHNVSTHTCEIQGDTAHCETYVLFGLLDEQNTAVVFGGGRYVDRLERREGIWKIALRRTLIDWMCTAEAGILKAEHFVGLGYPKGTKNRHDISYRRPLSLDGPTPPKW